MPALKNYASHESSSKGRRFAETPANNRGEFQRDRDRIVHSAAFRRLEYKTQVFVNHEGDMFRTRMTHTIEVAQIARSIARSLQVNEDLTEAIALSHDLGHTPFGHAGQDSLNTCMANFGGFEHNLQALRIVDDLEEKYAEFDGLNLCFETREGIIKHCSQENALALAELGQRFLDNRQPGIEAQITNLGDEIAYLNHDVDDGLRSGLLNIEQMREVELFQTQYEIVTSAYPQLPDRRTIHEVVRRMVNAQVTDLIDSSIENINTIKPSCREDILNLEHPIIRYSDDMLAKKRQLKTFLRHQLYKHYRVHRMSRKGRQIVAALFHCFFDDYQLLPSETQLKVKSLQQSQGETGFARAIADYIAGMTDRYAISEYQRLFSAKSLT
ncbi:MAG: deoxyguanosinetriphosphate triphosphohydrolase [Thiohalomonadales bacterium]